MTTMTISQVRARIREVVERVQRGEDVTITQNGAEVAVVSKPKRKPHPNPAAEQLIREAETLAEEMRALRGQPLRLTGAITPEQADQWVRELRAERDEW
jgi:prevent-host-death family protein